MTRFFQWNQTRTRRVSTTNLLRMSPLMMNKVIICQATFILSLLPQTVLSKGGGGSGSSGSSGSSSSSGSYSGGGGYSGNRWVFWYYGPYGTQCGNICIITFCILGFIILSIILCGVWRCCQIRKQSRKDKRDDEVLREQFPELFENDIESQEMQQTRYSNNNNNNNTSSTAAGIYPPLAKPQNAHLSDGSFSNDLSTTTRGGNPPSYEGTSPAPEPIAFRGKKHEAKKADFDAAKKFNQDNPPQEELPPPEHIDYIRRSGGASVYKFVAEQTLLNKHVVLIEDNGRKIRFHGGQDAMVQTNYPFFDPFESEEFLSADSSSGISSSSKQKSNPDSVTIDVNIAEPPPPAYASSPKTGIYLSPSTSVRRKLYYFEITVASSINQRKTTIAIGLATKPYPNYRLPGWNSISVGYHSDDGHKFNDAFGGRPYGPEWGEVGDTVGCGYYPDTGYVFFTKNGESFGDAFTGMRHIWFPTVGADGTCRLEVNFGDGDREFRYKPAVGYGPTGPIKPPHDGRESSRESLVDK